MMDPNVISYATIEDAKNYYSYDSNRVHFLDSIGRYLSAQREVDRSLESLWSHLANLLSRLDSFPLLVENISIYMNYIHKL